MWETKFAYKEVPKIDSLRGLLNEISHLEKELESTAEDQDSATVKEYLEKRKKVLDEKLCKPTKQNAEALIVFCMNCGAIIGTSGA